MPHELTINHDNRYVHLIYSGEVDIAERQQARDEVFQACEDHQLARALVDMRNSNIRMSERDVVNFASNFQRAKLLPNYRLACIIGPQNQTENLVEIIITLEGINVKYFMNFDDAEQWLTAV